MSLDYCSNLGIINIQSYSDLLRFSKPQENHYFHSGLSFQNDAEQNDTSHLNLDSFGDDVSFYRYNTINIVHIKGHLKLCLTRCLSTFSTPTDELMFFAGPTSDKDLKELHDQLNIGYFRSVPFDPTDEQVDKLIEVLTPHFHKIGYDDQKISAIKRSIFCLLFSAEQIANQEKLKSSLFTSKDADVPLLSQHVTASFKLKYDNVLVDSIQDGHDALLSAVVSALRENKKISDLKFRIELDFRKIGSENLSLKMNVDLDTGKIIDYVFHDHFAVIQAYTNLDKLESDLDLVAQCFTDALLNKAKNMIAQEKISNIL